MKALTPQALKREGEGFLAKKCDGELDESGEKLTTENSILSMLKIH
jgi:hypothetical protein